MKLKFYIYTFMAFILTVIILSYPSDCLMLASNGLNLWFQKMIPTLFPFMVLSGIMIRMNMTGTFVKILTPVLGKLFKLNADCIYGIAIGFLCGFPMGAHVAAELYEHKKISRVEATLLLSFCNNIGPVYFLSFVLPTLKIKSISVCLFAMYGLPFLYGLFLRHTIYRDCFNTISNMSSGKAALPLLKALDESVLSSLYSIAKLGGYMIFFNLLFIFPILFINVLQIQNEISQLLTGSIGCLLEITGGIELLQNSAPYWVLCVLPFGGLSCIAQTYSMVRETDLSISEYVMHKTILTAITVFYYLLSAGISSLT